MPIVKFDREVSFGRAYSIYYFDYYYCDCLETLNDVIHDLEVLGAALRAKKIDHARAYRHIPDIIDKLAKLRLSHRKYHKQGFPEFKLTPLVAKLN